MVRVKGEKPTSIFQDVDTKESKLNPQFKKLKGLLRKGTCVGNTNCLNNNLELCVSSKARKMPWG